MKRVSQHCQVHHQARQNHKSHGQEGTLNGRNASKISAENPSATKIQPVEPSPALKEELVKEVKALWDKQRALAKAVTKLTKIKAELTANGTQSSGIQIFSDELSQTRMDGVLNSVDTLRDHLHPRKVERVSCPEDTEAMKVRELLAKHQKQIESLRSRMNHIAQKDTPCSMDDALELYGEIADLATALETRGQKEGEVSGPRLVQDAIQALVDQASILHGAIRVAIEAARDASIDGRPDADFCWQKFNEGIDILHQLLVSKDRLSNAYETRQARLKGAIARSTCTPLSDKGKETAVKRWHVTSMEKIDRKQQELEVIQTRRYLSKKILSGQWIALEKKIQQITDELHRLDHIAQSGGVPPIKSIAFGRYVAVANALKAKGYVEGAGREIKASPWVSPSACQATKEGSRNGEETADPAGVTASTQRLTLAGSRARNINKKVGGVVEGQCALLEQIEKQLKDSGATVGFATVEREKEFSTIKAQVFALRDILNDVEMTGQKGTPKQVNRPPILPGVEAMLGQMSTLRESINQAHDSARANTHLNKADLQEKCREFQKRLEALKEKRDTQIKRVEQKSRTLGRLYKRDREGIISRSDRHALQVLGFFDAKGKKAEAYRDRYEEIQDKRAKTKSNLDTGWKRLNRGIREMETSLANLKKAADSSDRRSGGWWG